MLPAKLKIFFPLNNFTGQMMIRIAKVLHIIDIYLIY